MTNQTLSVDNNNSDLHRNRRKVVIKSISDCISSGWCLLQSNCPVCSTVLIKNKQNQTYCCNCKLFCKTESEMSNLQQKNDQLCSSSKLVSLSSHPQFAQLTKDLQNQSISDETKSYLSSYNEIVQTDFSIANPGASRNHDEPFVNFQRDNDDSGTARYSEDIFETGRICETEKVKSDMCRMNEASKLLGEAMLSGLTMLGVTCDCGCPLVQNRKIENSLAKCVICVKQYKQVSTDEYELIKTDGNRNAQHRNSANENNSPPLLSDSDEHTTKSNDDNKLIQNCVKNFPNGKIEESNYKTDGYNNTISTPSSPESYDSFEHVLLPITKSSKTSAMQPVKQTDTSIEKVNLIPTHEMYVPSPLTDSQIECDRISSLLGQRMLSGFTLLAENCPNEKCHCPLVRKGKSGKKECVQCCSIYCETNDKSNRQVKPTKNQNDSDKETESKVNTLNDRFYAKSLTDHTVKLENSNNGNLHNELQNLSDVTMNKRKLSEITAEFQDKIDNELHKISTSSNSNPKAATNVVPVAASQNSANSPKSQFGFFTSPNPNNLRYGNFAPLINVSSIAQTLSPNESLLQSKTSQKHFVKNSSNGKLNHRFTAPNIDSDNDVKSEAHRYSEFKSKQSFEFRMEQNELFENVNSTRFIAIMSLNNKLSEINSLLSKANDLNEISEICKLISQLNATIECLQKSLKVS